jgi:predicted aspartyl protease
MAIREGLFYVPLRVGKHTVPAMVDTGAKDQVFLNQKLLKTWNMESLATKGRPYRAAGIGGETSGRQFPMPLIFLGDEPVRDVIVDAGTGPWSARIGTELLARWRVTFDFRNNVMWLE